MLLGHGGFNLDASTQHGDAENDFGVECTGDKGKGTLTGSVAGGGPQIKITTQNGDITVRKSEVEPLPPPKPMPPPKVKPVPPAKPATPASPAPPAPPKNITF